MEKAGGVAGTGETIWKLGGREGWGGVARYSIIHIQVGDKRDKETGSWLGFLQFTSPPPSFHPCFPFFLQFFFLQKALLCVVTNAGAGVGNSLGNWEKNREMVKEYIQ